SPALANLTVRANDVWRKKRWRPVSLINSLKLYTVIIGAQDLFVALAKLRPSQASNLTESCSMSPPCTAECGGRDDFRSVFHQIDDESAAKQETRAESFTDFIFGSDLSLSTATLLGFVRQNDVFQSPAPAALSWYDIINSVDVRNFAYSQRVPQLLL